MYLIKFYNLLSPIICPWWLSGKESAYQCRRHKSNPCIGKIPLEKEMATHSNILAGKSHGQRSPAGYNPWGHKESDKTL